MTGEVKKSFVENMVVRRANLDDIPQLEGLISKSYSQLLRNDYNNDVLDAALPLICKPNIGLVSSGRYYVIDSEEEGLLACGGWSVEGPGGGRVRPGVGHIRHFATSPEKLRKGLANMIYSMCFEEAREAGIEVFECVSSLSAENFYKKMRFKSIEPINIDLPVAGAFPCVLMRAKLSDAE